MKYDLIKRLSLEEKILFYASPKSPLKNDIVITAPSFSRVILTCRNHFYGKQCYYVRVFSHPLALTPRHYGFACRKKFSYSSPRHHEINCRSVRTLQRLRKRLVEISALEYRLTKPRKRLISRNVVNRSYDIACT